MCDKGKYCKEIDNNNLYMCVEIEKDIKKFLPEKCTQTDLFNECDNNFPCDTNNKSTPTTACTDPKTIYKTSSGDYECKDNDFPSGLYFYKKYDNNVQAKGSPKTTPRYDNRIIGGIITFIHDNYNEYNITKIEILI